MLIYIKLKIKIGLTSRTQAEQVKRWTMQGVENGHATQAEQVKGGMMRS